MQSDTPIETTEEQTPIQHKAKKSPLRARNGRFTSKSGASKQTSPKKKAKKLCLENGVFYSRVIVDQLKDDKEKLLDEIHKKSLEVQHYEWQLSEMENQVEKLKEQCHSMKRGFWLAIIFALSSLTLLVAHHSTHICKEGANQQSPIEVRQ